MRKMSNVLAPILVAASVSVQADVVGGTVEASYWHAGLSGDATIGSDTVDAEDDLDFGKDSFFEIAASIEHPVPVIPNVRLKYTALDQTESGNLSSSFDGVSGSIDTNFDLTHYGAVFYYEILDNWVSIDLGLDIRKFDGQLKISDGTNKSITEIDETLPLGYLAAEFAMPFTDMALGAEISAISYSGNSIHDAKIRLRQGISLAFIELGYRQLGIKLDDVSDLDVDMDFSGVYFATGIDF